MQVEELAFLVKDNLPCKHLVLSVEEALVNFLDTDTRYDHILPTLELMSELNSCKLVYSETLVPKKHTKWKLEITI